MPPPQWCVNCDTWEADREGLCSVCRLCLSLAEGCRQFSFTEEDHRWVTNQLTQVLGTVSSRVLINQGGGEGQQRSSSPRKGGGEDKTPPKRESGHTPILVPPPISKERSHSPAKAKEEKKERKDKSRDSPKAKEKGGDRPRESEKVTHRTSERKRRKDRSGSRNRKESRKEETSKKKERSSSEVSNKEPARSSSWRPSLKPRGDTGTGGEDPKSSTPRVAPKHLTSLLAQCYRQRLRVLPRRCPIPLGRLLNPTGIGVAIQKGSAFPRGKDTIPKAI